MVQSRCRRPGEGGRALAIRVFDSNISETEGFQDALLGLVATRATARFLKFYGPPPLPPTLAKGWRRAGEGLTGGSGLSLLEVSNL